MGASSATTVDQVLIVDDKAVICWARELVSKAQTDFIVIDGSGETFTLRYRWLVS